MTTDISRPFDLLNGAVNKPVLVRLKGDRLIRGNLKSFDQHMNIVLSDADETRADEKIKIGNVIVRGDNILYISP